MTETGRNKAPVQSSGIFVVDKPSGLSSAGLVAVVKRALGVRKIGHAGTLDPLATGVMVCCVNQATKLARFFLGGDKSYVATLLLGVETDTQDASGRVTATQEVAAFSKKELSSMLAQFSGDIEQVPPVYSALKHRGVRLYRLARQGRPVEKPPRQVHISAIRLLGIDLPEVRFEVTCSAGTYIRTLCADIGQRLGCGGHLKQLRRTAACGFPIDEAVTLETLKQLAVAGKAFERMIPMAEALRAFPEVVAEKDAVVAIGHGRPLLKQALGPMGGGPKKYIKVVDRNHRLLAILTSSDGKNSYDYESVFI
jgi:tRNA pseudouridine55 synthase